MSRNLCAGRSMFDAPRARPLLLAAALLSAALLAAAGQGVGATANATNDTASEAEAVEVSADNCECECCAPGRCDQGLRSFATVADGFSACSHALCNKRFYACKDRYYDEAETFATYLDCSCRCSDDEGPEGAVPRRFASRGAARCTVAECDRQGFCEGGTASADFTGVPDLDFVLLVAPGAEAEAEETPEPNCQCACCAQAARIGPSASLVCEAPEDVDRVTNALGLAKLLTRVGKPSECVPEICASRFPAACPGPAAVANGSAFAFATYDWEGEGFPHGGD